MGRSHAAAIKLFTSFIMQIFLFLLQYLDGQEMISRAVYRSQGILLLPEYRVISICRLTLNFPINSCFVLDKHIEISSAYKFSSKIYA